MEQMLMRAEEVAKALGLGRSKTYEMMASGALPVVRVGRAVRVPRAALEQWVRSNTRNAEDDGGIG
jgi:excisionase family DNA binding protein